MLAVVRNLTVVNFAVVVGIIAYALARSISLQQITLLVLTAMLWPCRSLPATFTLAAALGARTLAVKGVLLTRLSALHEAATIDVLCADKTGTLTLNEMSVREFVRSSLVTTRPTFSTLRRWQVPPMARI